MKVVGIVAEYNPFHNGHRYHIEEARKCTGADFVVVVMSGDFVQRGEPAVIDKYHRTEMALSQGADLVLELPAAFACASAEYFATGAVSLLHALGCVDTLCFGSECGHLDLLEEIADLFIQEPSEYKEYLKTALKSGYSFPAARDEALKEYFAEDLVKTAQIASVLSAPNNILGIEYIKALKVLGSSIRPVTITRMGQGYHETTFSDSFCSATALRRLLETPNTAPGCMQSQVPEAVFRF